MSESHAANYAKNPQELSLVFARFPYPNTDPNQELIQKLFQTVNGIFQVPVKGGIGR